MGRIAQFFQSLGERFSSSGGSRPAYLRVLSRVTESTATLIRKRPGHFYAKLAGVLVTTYFLADLAAMGVEFLMPQAKEDAKRKTEDVYRGGRPTQADYDVITRRNLFSSKGLIPEENAAEEGPPEGTPMKTTLPFELLGTIILENELQSLATIEDKTANTVYAVRVNEEIPAMAKITKIEAKRVTFINLRNNRNEFVEIPEDPTAPAISFTAGNAGPVKAISDTRFSIPRSEIEKTMQNLNAVLSQALARPVTENGQPAGFRLSQIVRGSIYEQLGLKDGDILRGFDGQPITDPMAAWEKLGDLKSLNQLELNVKRDGKDMTFTYDIY